MTYCHHCCTYASWFWLLRKAALHGEHITINYCHTNGALLLLRDINICIIKIRWLQLHMLQRTNNSSSSILQMELGYGRYPYQHQCDFLPLFLKWDMGRIKVLQFLLFPNEVIPRTDTLEQFRGNFCHTIRSYPVLMSDMMSYISHHLLIDFKPDTMKILDS